MINEMYLGEEVTGQMRESFLASGELIVLQDFFDNETYEVLRRKLNQSEGELKNKPDKFSYELLSSEQISECIDIEKLKAFIAEIVGKGVSEIEVSVKRFGHRNYTLLHDDTQTRGLEFFVFVCDAWAEQWGGYKVYTQEGEEPLLIFPEENKFCLINSKDRNGFLKYVNNLAGNNSLVLIEGVVHVPAEN